MKLAVICFTRAGSCICRKLVQRFRALGEGCDGYVQKKYSDEFQEQPGICAMEEPVGTLTGRLFAQVDGIIYIGAAGIAVRAIAPCLKDKMTDPAVVVADEKGRYAVSLLSGHVGGANSLTCKVAEILGGEPVITTASDVQEITATDVWAKERGLLLSDRIAAREVAAALVDGEPVGFYSDFKLQGPVPRDYTYGQMCRFNVWVTCRMRPEADSAIAMFLPENAQTLRLIPKVLTVGIGCRKGVDGVRIRAAVKQVLEAHNLEPRAIAQIASVDRKREEAGLCALAGELGIPFVTFSAGTLERIPGTLSESDFVRAVIGTGNVCERAALAGAGEGAVLLVPRQVCDGVTVAVARAYMEIGAEKA